MVPRTYLKHVMTETQTTEMGAPPLVKSRQDGIVILWLLLILALQSVGTQRSSAQKFVMTGTRSTLMDVIQSARPLKTVGLARLLLEESQFVLLYVLLQILTSLELTLALTMIT